MSTREIPEMVLECLEASRRSFIQKLIVGSPFVAPAVASFVMSGLSVGEARAQVPNVTIPALPPIGLGAAATGLLLAGAALLRRGIHRKPDETTNDDESK
jgi:hypothetical protein